MEYKKIKNNKGITLIALVLTIVISLLLIVSVTVGFEHINETNEYYKIKQDIIALTKASQSYYLRTGEIPVTLTSIAHPDSEFSSFIKNYDGGEKCENRIKGIDRNPNDNDVYYVLYSPSNKTSVEEYLPEVNIRSTESTYIINAKSLTVYCREGYILDGLTHYTASEDFSGSMFAREYYKDLAIIDQKMSLEIDTGTRINIGGTNVDFSTYAHNKSIIEITVKIEDTEFYNSKGEKVAFADFEKKPTKNSFRMSISPLNGEKAYEGNENIAATNVIIDKQTCVFQFNLANIDISKMGNRRRIKFSYDEDNGFYYDDKNKVNYNTMLTSYQSLRSFEFENNTDEIIIASVLNKTNKRADLERSIKTISTNSNWDYYHTYADVVTTGSQQKYIINDGLNDFEKAYTLNLNFSANPSRINFRGGSVGFFVQDENSSSHSYIAKGTGNQSIYSIDAKKNSKVSATISLTGFDEDSNTIKNCEIKENNDENKKEITLNATQYTFTLTTNVDNPTYYLKNTTYNDNKDMLASGITDDNKKKFSQQGNQIDGYMGDEIEYNVTKNFYRFSNEVGKSSSTKKYTMGVGSKTENITLAQNIVTPKQYEISHVGIDYATKSKSKTGYGTIGYNSYVTKVDLLFTLYHSNAFKRDNVEFKFTNQPLLSNKVYSGLSKGKAYNVDYSYNLYTYGGAFPPPDTNVINNDNNNVAATLTTGGLESADLKKIYIKVTYAVR